MPGTVNEKQVDGICGGSITVKRAVDMVHPGRKPIIRLDVFALGEAEDDQVIELNHASALLFASILVEMAGPYDGNEAMEILKEMQKAAMRSMPATEV